MEQLKVFLSNKRNLIIVIAVVIVILLLIILAALQSKSKSVNETASSEEIVTQVGDKKISNGDLRAEAEKQYSKKGIDDSTLDTMQDLVTERAILDQESSKLGVSVTEDEINKRATYQFSDPTNITDNTKQAIKYEVLRSKITSKVVNSRNAYVISFWIPPYNYGGEFTKSEETFFESQRASGKLAIDEIEQLLQQNTEPYEIVKTILNKYPALRSILALNGYIVDGKKDITKFTQPKPYEYNDSDQTKVFYDALFKAKVDAVTVLREAEGEGSGSKAFVVKSINNTSKYDTYNDWLAAKYKELVKNK